MQLRLGTAADLTLRSLGVDYTRVPEDVLSRIRQYRVRDQVSLVIGAAYLAGADLLCLEVDWQFDSTNWRYWDSTRRWLRQVRHLTYAYSSQGWDGETRLHIEFVLPGWLSGSDISPVQALCYMQAITGCRKHIAWLDACDRVAAMSAQHDEIRVMQELRKVWPEKLK